MKPHLVNAIIEFPCYLLKSILLQGHMFITTRHIAFFAYIPHKTVSPHIDHIM